MDFLPKELEDITIDYINQLELTEKYDEVMKELKTKYVYKIDTDGSVRYERGDRVISANRILPGGKFLMISRGSKNMILIEEKNGKTKIYF